MAPAHMDRLSALDVSFLTNESSSAHMHVGAVLIFEGPPPSYDDLAEHVRARLHLVPRFRQKLAYPPLQTGRPFWIDDPTFNLEYHLRHSALPAPGSEEQLRRMVGRIFSHPLDRPKPLWELWPAPGPPTSAASSETDWSRCGPRFRSTSRTRWRACGGSPSRCAT